MAKVHSTAIIDKTAILANDVEVGPYCMIGPGVKIGVGTKIGPHCIIHRDTIIGENNNFYCASSIGADPQDLKYKGERTFLKIGDNNIIREYVTLNRATGEGNKTIIGSGNLFMTQSHLGHNSVVGNGNVIANSAAIGGHVVIEDNVILCGLVGIHQFCRAGERSITGGFSKITQDVPPYSMCDGIPANIYGINKIGLDRAGMPKGTQLLIRRAFKILFAEGLAVGHAVEKAQKGIKQIPEIKRLINFVKSSKRGVCHWIR